MIHQKVNEIWKHENYMKFKKLIHKNFNEKWKLKTQKGRRNLKIENIKDWIKFQNEVQTGWWNFENKNTTISRWSLKILNTIGRWKIWKKNHKKVDEIWKIKTWKSRWNFKNKNTKR